MHVLFPLPASIVDQLAITCADGINWLICAGGASIALGLLRVHMAPLSDSYTQQEMWDGWKGLGREGGGQGSVEGVTARRLLHVIGARLVNDEWCVHTHSHTNKHKHPSTEYKSSD